MSDTAHDTGPQRRSPAWALLTVPVTLAVTAVVRAVDPWATFPPALVFGLAGGGAVLVGVPLLVWSLERNRMRLPRLLALGAFAGALPIGLTVVSGVLGLVLRSPSLAYARWFLGQRAPLPLAGNVTWTTLSGIVLEGIVVGLVSAAVCRAILLRRQ